MTHYTRIGDTRGECGVKHRTMLAAYECCRSDESGCGSQGGYSDRTIYEAGKDGYRVVPYEEKEREGIFDEFRHHVRPRRMPGPGRGMHQAWETARGAQ